MWEADATAGAEIGLVRGLRKLAGMATLRIMIVSSRLVRDDEPTIPTQLPEPSREADGETGVATGEDLDGAALRLPRLGDQA
jgi:hypothetical protein